VVLPHAVDAQVADGVALFPEAVLLEHPYGGRVPRHDRRLDAVEAELAEGEVDRDAHRLGREAMTVPTLRDRVAEIRILEDAAEDLAERDTPDELGVEEDPERVTLVGGCVRCRGLDVGELGVERVEAVLAHRLPLLQEPPVVLDEREQGARVARLEVPEHDPLTPELHGRYRRTVDTAQHDAVVDLLRRDLDAAEYDEIRELWKKHSIAEDERDLPGLISTLTEDCVYELVQTGDHWEGHEGAARFYTQLLTAFPDIKFELTNIVIGPQGVCEEAHVTATHEAEWLGQPPTGERIEFRVVIFFPWSPEKRLFEGERVYFDAPTLVAGSST
jgi:predicted ester cyclase